MAGVIHILSRVFPELSTLSTGLSTVNPPVIHRTNEHDHSAAIISGVMFSSNAMTISTDFSKS